MGWAQLYVGSSWSLTGSCSLGRARLCHKYQSALAAGVGVRGRREELGCGIHGNVLWLLGFLVVLRGRRKSCALANFNDHFRFPVRRGKRKQRPFLRVEAVYVIVLGRGMGFECIKRSTIDTVPVHTGFVKHLL